MHKEDAKALRKYFVSSCPLCAFVWKV